MKQKIGIVIGWLMWLCIGATYGQYDVVRLEKFTGQSICGVIANGAFDIKLSQGPTASATVNIRQDLVDKLSFELTDQGYVKLEFLNDITKYITSSKVRPEAVIVLNSLDYMKVTGACSVLARGEFTSEQTPHLQFSGTTYVGWVRLACMKDIFVDINGAAKIEECDFRTPERVSAVVAQSSKAQFKVDCGRFITSVSGVAFLDLSGRANASLLDVSGASAVEMRRFSADRHTVNVNGLSKVMADVTVEAAVDVSSLASFYYSGAGVVSGSGAKRL